MSVVDTKFELCRDAEYVLKIGRDFQNKDGFHGAHYDTVKLLCDTIEYLRNKLPKPDPDWKAICAKCIEGEIEPTDCEYYGEPNGCNSPIYGEHPTAKKSLGVGDAAAMRELKVLKEAVLDFCDVFTLVYPPNDGDCPAVLAGAFELLKDAIGIETFEIEKGDNNGSK